jgi:hypothetical protein
MPVGSFPRGVALVFRGKNVVQVLIAISKVLAVTKKVVSPLAVRLVLSRSWPKLDPVASVLCRVLRHDWMDAGGTKADERVSQTDRRSFGFAVGFGQPVRPQVWGARSHA